MQRSRVCVVLAAALLAGSGCRSRKTDAVVGSAEASGAPASPAPAAAATTPVGPEPALAQNTGGGGQGARDEWSDDDAGGAPEGGLKGQKKWRDTGVYVDGRPVAVLGFGELPITLAPTWVEERASVDIEPGSKGPGYRIVKQRNYRFDQYLTAIGVDLRKVKEIHVMGPKFTDTIVASGKDLVKRGKEFRFRFGAEVGGKAIPVVPPRFGNGRSPDKISAVMVYIDRPPPVLLPNQGLTLDGGKTIIQDVPYHGEPMKGGIRVYLDDRFVFHIKRPVLRDTPPDGRDAKGAPYWNLMALLRKHGVDTSRIVEGYVIRHERREERLAIAELEPMTFQIADKGSREIYLGDARIVTQNLAFHTRKLAESELPKILPDEEF